MTISQEVLSKIRAAIENSGSNELRELLSPDIVMALVNHYEDTELLLEQMRPELARGNEYLLRYRKNHTTNIVRDLVNEVYALHAEVEKSKVVSPPPMIKALYKREGLAPPGEK